jgi:hypothetical protein
MAEGMERQEMPCPACAEPILAAARKCKHCGVDVQNARQLFGAVQCRACAEMTSRSSGRCQFCGEPLTGAASLLNQPGSYNVPIRLERQYQSETAAPSGTYFASSTGVAFKGAVCPSCHSADYVKVYTLWHGIIAVLAFPIGLVCLAFPVHRCAECRNEYGAGQAVVKAFAILTLCTIAFVILGVIAILRNT